MNMGSKVDPNEVGMVPPEVDEGDAKIFGQVQKIIEDGQLQKLKVDQCKVYLRKNGLRLTGNKDTLIQRIKQHQEILYDGAEKKCPASSFVLNCKGEACTGDVVMPKKNVYKMIAEDMNMSSKVDPDEVGMVPPEVDEGDAKIFDKVQKIIDDGQLEKLKVDQCKAYLRKNGLRLTGNKDTLIQRIKQHLEILRDGAEKKYPASSFVLNCKGDACTGDVVMFEQNVYEMFNIASRSATGPPCGTRIVAGRIVKESYGAAKQQHTFTIEVLWSKGEKPLPPLYSLLIKGRNLYRFKTLRQRWEDEGKREKILMEKYSRGFVARSDREARIQEKEIRKQHKATRISRKEFNALSTAKSDIKMLQPGILVNSNLRSQILDLEKSEFQPQKLGSPFHHSGKPAVSQQQRSGLLADVGKSRGVVQTSYHQQVSQNVVECRGASYTKRVYSNCGKVPHQSPGRPYFLPIHVHQLPTHICPNRSWDSMYHRQPLRKMNVIPPMNPLRRQGHKPLQFCRYYARGNCTYGENCKFVH